MLKKSFLKICCIVILATAFIVPFNAWAGQNNNQDIRIYTTDDDGFRLYSYWDRRDRETFVQVTNTDDDDGEWVHVQIFNVPDLCNEFNFFDFYTPSDTHIYDLENLKANNGAELFPPTFDNGYGMFIVTNVDVPGGVLDQGRDLTGNFRIIDSSGEKTYEYRTNSPADSNKRGFEDRYVFNFNDLAGATMSDVIGISCDKSNQNGGVKCADPDDHNANFRVSIFDENENEFSCQRTAFTCLPSDQIGADFQEEEDVLFGGFNLGLNDLYVNSRGEPSICSGFLPTGFVRLDSTGETDGNRFVGFIGLNNGNGTGSMDSWWLENTD